MGRVRELHAAGDTPARIAERLNEAGFRTPRRRGPFTRERVHELFRRLGLNCGRAKAVRLGAGEWRLSDLAERVGAGPMAVRRWVAQGWVHARKPAGRRGWVVWADRREIRRLRHWPRRRRWGRPDTRRNSRRLASVRRISSKDRPGAPQREGHPGR